MKFFADWRNPALVLTAAAAIGFGVFAAVNAGNAPGGRIARVGNRVLTQADLNAHLRTRRGDAELLKLLDQYIIEDYAQANQVSVADSEVEQFIQEEKYRADANGMEWDKYLAQMGTTEEALRNDSKVAIYRVKLAVPARELQQLVTTLVSDPQAAAVYTHAPRYRVRALDFAEESKAKEAMGLLESAWRGGKEDEPTAQRAALLTASADGAVVPERILKVQTIVPDLAQKDKLPAELQKMVEALGGLQPGQCQLFALGEKRFQVVELMGRTDGEKPTYENRGLLIGQALINGTVLPAALLNSGKYRDLDTLANNYAVAWHKVYAAALRKAGVTFDTTDFPQARAQFKDVEKNYIASGE